MEERKKSHITTTWIVIAAISITQAVGAYQDYRIHQHLRNQIRTLQEQHLHLLQQVNANLDPIFAEVPNNR